MTTEVQKWRKASFIHMNKKNEALKELETLREEHTKLKQEHEILYYHSWLGMFVLWIWAIVCVCCALKIKL